MSNQISVVGNLTREPELRFLTSGRPVANLGIASSRRYMQNNEWQEQTSFFNVTVWGDMAQNVAASFKKGDRVMLSGRLESRQYETDQGEKRTAFEIVADEIGPSLRWATVQIERVARTSEQGKPSTVAVNHDPIYGETPEEPF